MNKQQTFKVGQNVICIKSCTIWNGITSTMKGETYKIFGIYKCACGIIELDLGIKNPSDMGLIICENCSHTTKSTSWLQCSPRFRVIDNYSDSAVGHLVNVKQITETSDVPMKNPSPIQPLKELVNN